jgi:ribosomal protein L30E
VYGTATLKMKKLIFKLLLNLLSRFKNVLSVFASVFSLVIFLKNIYKFIYYLGYKLLILSESIKKLLKSKITYYSLFITILVYFRKNLWFYLKKIFNITKKFIEFTLFFSLANTYLDLTPYINSEVLTYFTIITNYLKTKFDYVYEYLLAIWKIIYEYLFPVDEDDDLAPEPTMNFNDKSKSTKSVR